MNISIININKNIYCTSKALSLLSYFLTDDVGSRKVESLINWLENDKYKSAVLNYSYIKKDDNKIKIYCFYDGYEREEIENRDRFEIKKTNLIEIVKDWQNLYKKYRYIKITQTTEKIFLTGREEK